MSIEGFVNDVEKKQACCAGCRSRPFPMKLHQSAKSTIQQNRLNF